MDNTKQKIHNGIKSRKAVAPIIATLLMIAIAVVGGVMIYVFTQGFFGNSAISTSPTVDTITMSGYDMREIPAATGGVTTHELLTVTGFGDNAVDIGLKANGEAGSIYIKNVGTKTYTISRLEVNGVQLIFNGAATGPTEGEFGLITIPNSAATSAGTAFQPAGTILPGEEGTFVITFIGDGSVAGDNAAAAGRTIPVKMTSAGGSVYNFNVVIGSKA